MKIDPERLRELRSRRGLSQQQLADKSKVSARQIARIEAASASVAARETTVSRLCGALKVKRELLAGEAPLEPSRPISRTEAGIQINDRISPGVQLAYDLVKHRYGPDGPSRKDLINLAPMLFVLLAEGSLAWRRQHLEEVAKAMEHLRALGENEERSHLYFTRQQRDLDAGFEAEAASIDAADVRGDKVRDLRIPPAWQARDSGLPEEFITDPDILHGVVPFAYYLIKLSEDLNVPGIVNFEFGRDRVPDEPWGADPYYICRDELDRITGGSKQALWALEQGDVRLFNIPEELMSEQAKDSRISWLEDRLSDETRQKMEKLERDRNEFMKLVTGDSDEKSG